MTTYTPDPALELMDRIKLGHLWAHVSELAVLGYTVVPNVLTSPDTAALRSRAMTLLESEAGVQDDCGRRVWNLLRRDRAFARLLVDPKVDPLLDYLLGGARVLSSMQVNAVAPGASAQVTHSDTPFVPPPLPPTAYLANTIWCLDTWARDRGATEVVPGSHLVCRHPQGEPGPADVRPVECDAGSVIVMHGNLWHRSGPYGAEGDPDLSRVGVLALYCRTFVRPQESYSDLATHVVADDVEARERLGASIPYPFGRHGPDGRFAESQAIAGSPFL